jgi:hypothetical protein
LLRGVSVQEYRRCRQRARQHNAQLRRLSESLKGA